MQASNIDAAEYFLFLRPLEGLPTDFDLFLLNLLLAPPSSQTSLHRDRDEIAAPNHSSSTRGDTAHRDLLLSPSGSLLKPPTPTACDKFVPEALLACPMPLLNDFISVFHVDLDLAKAIQGARRRHANRIHKRLSRARQQGSPATTSEIALHSKLTTQTHMFEIASDAPRIYAELQAAAGHILGD